jgi:hypothetical protein
VEFNYQPRISRAAAQFFLNWAEDELRLSEKNITAALPAPGQLQDKRSMWAKARDFWQELHSRANSE